MSENKNINETEEINENKSINRAEVEEANQTENIEQAETQQEIYMTAQNKRYAAESHMDMLEAAELFKSLGDYKDAPLLATLCFDKAAKLKKSRRKREKYYYNVLVLMIPAVLIFLVIYFLINK